MINSELAQAIVDRTMLIINRNINIMNEKGYIIASGNKKRIGTFHEGAEKVIKSGEKAEVTIKEAETLEGVHPGISLPITFESRIVGVIGITGEPEDIRSYGELVRYTAELMLEQASLKDEIYLQKTARRSFFHDLLSGNHGNDENIFVQRGRMLGFDLSLSRAAIVVKMDIHKYNNKHQRNKNYEDIANNLMIIQKYEDELIKELRFKLNIKNEVIMDFFDNESLVILVQDEYKNPVQEKDSSINDFVKSIINIVKQKVEGDVFIGISEAYSDWRDYPLSYKEGELSLIIGQIFFPKENIYFFKDIQFEYSLTHIPKNLNKSFSSQILSDLINKPFNSYKVELLNTLETFFSKDMDVSKTAKSLFVHRNTVLFRLNKVKDITGYDANRFTDGFKLFLALKLLKLGS